MLNEGSHVTVISYHILILDGLPGVDPRFQIPFLGVIGPHLVVIGHGEPMIHGVVDVLGRGIDQLLYVRILFLLVVFVLIPGFHMGAIPLQHHEIGIQQQYHILFHFLLVQLYGHWLQVVQTVFQQNRLNHGHTVWD